MANTEIWWEPDDAETSELITKLGGEAVVKRAVAAVLPGRSVKLRVLTPGVSGSVVFLASPETAYDMRRVPEVDGVLKVGPAWLLADEVDRYNKWVAHVLSHASHFAMLDSPPNLKDIADEQPASIQALHYRHVGHTTFGERVKDLIAAEDANGLCRLIDSVLRILRPWQEMGDPITSKSLTSEGVYSFGSDPFPEFEHNCERLNAENIDDAEDQLDPAAFRSVGDLWRRDALGSERQLQTILHGDLHIDNILVDVSNSPTLIDFGATGEGHFLRDLSTLEAHLVLRGLAPKGDRVGPEHHRYVADLELLYSPAAFTDPGLQLGDAPLFTVVTRLRRYALYCLMRGDLSYMPQYAMGVLRHAIRLCTRKDETYTDAQRWASARVSIMLREALLVENHRLVIRDAESNQPANALGFLNDPPHEAVDPDGVNAPGIEPCSQEQWEALANVLGSARRVDFIGIVPMPLLSELLGSWPRATTRAEALPQLRYVTLPAPPTSRVGGLPVPNWRAALYGMRNVATVAVNSAISMSQFTQVTDSVTSNCVIRSSAAGGVSTIYFAAQVTGPGLADNAFVLSMLPDNDGRISDLIDNTFRMAEPLVMHEVDCVSIEDPSPTDHNEISFDAFRLSRYGTPAPKARCLRPIALTILRTRGPGRRVLVKMRSPLTDNDDFGMLSFLSSRILAVDVARAYGHDLASVEDAEDAFVELWERIGSPNPFLLPEDIFVQAAKRDVYETTLLELGADRFTRHGVLVLERAEINLQLGFVVLTVDLKPDEVAAARRTGQAIKDPNAPLLRVMEVDDLLSGRHVVNSVMRERKQWLIENCLGPHVLRLGRRGSWA